MTAASRQRMIAHHLQRRGITDPRVLAAFAQVPREAFVSDAHQGAAYDDLPLSIGHGQTISQPYVVALTAQALGLAGHERLLEIGTGSGYAAAILSVLAREVHTIERIEPLARSAAARLRSLGLSNVVVHHGDGTLGVPERAPYQAIAVAAGAPRPPPSLLAQLAIGGRLVIPYGDERAQRLARITRASAGAYEEQTLAQVRFVPLVGAEGWPTTAPPDDTD